MIRTLILNGAGQIERMISNYVADNEDVGGMTVVERDVPDGYPETHGWDAQAGQFFAKPVVPPPPAPNRDGLCMPFHANAAANLTLTNLPSAARFLANSNRNSRKADLSRFVQVRLIARVMVAGTAGAALAARWADSDAASIGAFQQLGASEVSIALNSTGTKDTGWIDLAPAAVGDNRWVAIREGGGTGTTPNAQIGALDLYFR